MFESAQGAEKMEATRTGWMLDAKFRRGAALRRAARERFRGAAQRRREKVKR